MENAILFGNGFNLLSKGCPSWHDLLIGISDKGNIPILEEIPPTLQYEQVYLSPSSTFSDLSHENEETKLKDAVKRRLVKLSTNAFYESLKSLDVNLFLTTNYDHAFYDNNLKKIREYDNTEKLYSIRRWKSICDDGKNICLYSIHGDIGRTSSIMLGLDHYGGALAKVQDYVKGNYRRIQKVNGKDYVHPQVPSIRKRLKEKIEISPLEYGFKNSGFGLVSWIDSFFFTNLHIIGITLDFSEIDIWWLLSRRARLLKSKLVTNKIFYYPTFPISEIHYHLPKLRLLERLGVQIVYHKLTQDIETGIIDYPSIYNIQINNLKNNL